MVVMGEGDEAVSQVKLKTRVQSANKEAQLIQCTEQLWDPAQFYKAP